MNVSFSPTICEDFLNKLYKKSGYEELRKVDVRPYCEERDGMLYLNWAKCIDLLHEHGAENVYWLPIPDPNTGNSLRMVNKVFTDKNNVSNQCYETRIMVVIDDKTYDI